MRSVFIKSFLIVLLLPGITSCSPKEIFFNYFSFANAEWNRDDPAVFNLKIEDNSQPYDLSIELRHKGDYPFSNIWLVVDCRLPDGNSRKDTIGAELADVKGKWYGKGLSLYNLSIPYKTSAFFPDTAVYTYSIRQEMQVDPLKGISDIGLKVSKKPVK